MERFEPSKDLRKNILFQIVKEEHRRAKNYLLASCATATASIVGVIFSARYVMQAVSQSSFYRYVSLLFSDSDIVLSHWREFAFSLVESLPFFAVTLVLVAIVVLMVSIRVFTNNTRRSSGFSFGN
jgi:uncharacterized membrane protein YciS (DUF1049 family)